jgi:hypothetical protein
MCLWCSCCFALLLFHALTLPPLAFLAAKNTRAHKNAKQKTAKKQKNKKNSANRNKKPEAIVFFRDGVAENQFDEVLKAEYQALRDVSGGAAWSFSVSRRARERPFFSSFRPSSSSSAPGPHSERKKTKHSRPPLLLDQNTKNKQACAELEEGYYPPITFVVVLKRHGTRREFFFFFFLRRFFPAFAFAPAFSL